MTDYRVQVEGLATVRRQLTQLGMAEERNELRDGLKDAARIVATDAQRRVPEQTGRARASVRASAGGNRAFVLGGRASVPYYGWLDFGTRTPRKGNNRAEGPWRGSGAGPARGRFIYPAIDAKRPEVERAVDDAMGNAIKALGLD